MNSTNVTTNGYVGSQMYTTTLPSVLSTYITPVFGSHVLEYSNNLTHTVNNSLYNKLGSNSGAASANFWYTRKLDLMNETQVYGHIAFSSSGYDIGSDNIQFPLFRLKPEFVNKGRNWYWLRDVVNSSNFAVVGHDRACWNSTSGNNAGVRPYFYID